MLREMIRAMNAHFQSPKWMQLGAQVRNLRNFQKTSALSKLLNRQQSNKNDEDIPEMRQRRILDCLRPASVFNAEQKRESKNMSSLASSQPQSQNQAQAQAQARAQALAQIHARPQPQPIPKPMPMPIQKAKPMIPSPRPQPTSSTSLASSASSSCNEQFGEDRKNFYIQKFSRDVIEVADALSMAISTIPVEESNTPGVRSVFEGLKLTEALLQQILQRHGLKKVMPLNEKFDPRYHEALKTKAVQGTKPNVVIEVGRVGYKLHDRCIRPALVVISE